MAEPTPKPVRRDLLAGMKPRATREPLDDEAIRAAAANSGFDREDAPAGGASEPPSKPSESRELVPVDQPLRRQRKKSPYSEAFSGRLSLDAINALYEEANAREVPIGRVFDEMVAAWRAATGKTGSSEE